MTEKKKGFNVASFVKGSPEEKNMTAVIPEVTSPVTLAEAGAKPVSKRTRKQKFDSDPVPTPTEAANSMAYVQQNIPYEVAFRTTNEQLDETIAQLNGLSLDTMSDLQAIRANRTLKNKFMTVSNLTEQAVAILNAKLTAIKEKNKVIGDINNLELKRLKDLKIDANQQDADDRIADLYSAFVNTPIGTMGGGLSAPFAPSQQSMLMVGGAPEMARGTIMPNGVVDDQATWQNNLDPAKQRMLLQAKGAMDICVIYDEATGGRHFAAIDRTTGQELQGVELPNPDSVWELTLNLAMRIAKDTNRGTTYPVIVVGGGTPGSMQQF